MRNLRELDILTSKVCNLYEQTDYMWKDRIAFFQMVGAAVSFVLFGAIGIPLDAFLVPSWVVFVVLIPVLFILWQSVPFLGRLHPLHGVQHTSLRSRGREYLTLDDEERREYPANILRIVRDPDLLPNQAHDLSQEMQVHYQAIMRRRNAREKIVKRQVDIDPIIEHMREQRKYIESDTKVYLNVGE